MKMKVFAVVFGAITLLFALYGNGVAQFAHLGGALGGYLMIRYWRGQPPFGGRGGGGGGSGGKKNHLRRVH
jgi:membrane associated rhomboid family serine protease